jgi:predicted nucleic acid-binding protein
MRFWDSSAVVPLIAREKSTPWARSLLRADGHALVWVLSPVEVRSALARRQRQGEIGRDGFRQACRRAERLFAAFSQIPAVETVTIRALRLLDSHPLRAADALQLAAALVAAQERPDTLPFVTLDTRLRDAAEREGFEVLADG